MKSNLKKWDSQINHFQHNNLTLVRIDYEQGYRIIRSSNSTRSIQIGALFPIRESNVELQVVEMLLNSVKPGMEVSFYIYQQRIISSGGSIGIDYEPIAGPYSFTIGSDVSGWRLFNLRESEEGYTPLTLEKNQTYACVVKVAQGEKFRYFASPLDIDESGIFFNEGGDRWNLLGHEPYMRLNFDKSLSVEEKVKSSPFHIAQNVPNPFDQQTVISYTLKEAADVSVTFTDLSGKVVRTVNKGIQPSGSHLLTVEAGDFAKGIYFYTFAIDGQRVTKKMVVNSFE